jgi:hypothetical protein
MCMQKYVCLSCNLPAGHRYTSLTCARFHSVTSSMYIWPTYIHIYIQIVYICLNTHMRTMTEPHNVRHYIDLAESALTSKSWLKQRTVLCIGNPQEICVYICSLFIRIIIFKCADITTATTKIINKYAWYNPNDPCRWRNNRRKRFDKKKKVSHFPIFNKVTFRAQVVSDM